MEEINEIQNKIQKITQYPFSNQPCEYWSHKHNHVNLEGKSYASCDEFKISWRDKDNDILVGIYREYVQEFVESNFETLLTEEELQDFEIFMWEQEAGETYNWMDRAVTILIEDRKR